jgi:tetratricopeptide (TPR) repeat protein
MRSSNSSTEFRSPDGVEWGILPPSGRCLALTNTNRKSQIAIEYAYRFRGLHPQSHVFWVYAATSARFYDAYQDIARRLKLSGHDVPTVDPRELVLDWFNEQDSHWLMILDNADDACMFFSSNNAEMPSKETPTTEKPLIHYLPTYLSSDKLLLITTRRGNLGEDLSNGEECIEVPPFDVREAQLLLRLRLTGRASGKDSPEATKLLKILACIPLAVTQAAAFIRRNRMSLPKYLAALEKDDENLKESLNAELQDARRDRGFPSAVFRTWKLSFNQIRVQEPRAAEMMSLMAMLDRREIPESLLKEPDDNDINFLTAIGTLKNYGFIVQEIDSETFAMHRMVQLSIQDWLQQANQRVNYEELAIKLLSDRFPTAKHENWKICQSLYPHAQAVLRYNSRSDSVMKARAILLHVVGWYEQEQGSFDFAETTTLEALTINEKILGINAVRTSSSRTLLGSILISQRKYEEAGKIFQQILEYDEKMLGKNQHTTLISMHNLATVLSEQGKIQEAEKMLQQAIKSKEIVLGKKHSSTLASMTNLAQVLSKQRKYKEAEEIFQQTLELSETVLEKKHPDTLLNVWCFANFLDTQQRYDEAEPLYRRASTGFRETLGPGHPHTLVCIRQEQSMLKEGRSRGQNEDNTISKSTQDGCG